MDTGASRAARYKAGWLHSQYQNLLHTKFFRYKWLPLLVNFLPNTHNRHPTACPLQWSHNGHDGISSHQPQECLLNRLLRRRSKKTSKLRVTGLCEGNSPWTGEFPAQRASNAENVSIWWCHHALKGKLLGVFCEFKLQYINSTSKLHHSAYGQFHTGITKLCLYVHPQFCHAAYNLLLHCIMHTCQVTLDISRSTIENQWCSWKYPG